MPEANLYLTAMCGEKLSLEHRCLVPVDDFIEWKRVDPKTKLPWAFAMKDGEPFALGGGWRHWRSSDKQMDTFAIITTEPNELLAEKTGHDRMPVIIKRSDYQRWLEPGSKEQPPIDLILPFDSDEMKAWRLDRRVNNVRINEPSLADAIEADEPAPEKLKRKRKEDDVGQMGMFGSEGL